jgi:hypothetical protein
LATCKSSSNLRNFCLRFAVTQRVKTGKLRKINHQPERGLGGGWAGCFDPGFGRGRAGRGGGWRQGSNGNRDDLTH